MTLNILTDRLNATALSVLRHFGDRVMKITPEGETVWETKSWSTLRSDFNGIALRSLSTLSIAGSPARTDQTNNAFGDINIIQCFHKMISFVETSLKIELPHVPQFYTCSRLDWNHMFKLGGQISVGQALNYLRHAETRGINVSTEEDTVYWNRKSQYLSMKAYNKFKHALASLKKKQAFYTDQELMLLEALIRFELRIGRYYFKKLKDNDKLWYELTTHDIERLFNTEIKKIIGDDMNIQNHDGLKEKFNQAAHELGFTDRMGSQAYHTFNMIKLEGYENVKRSMKKSSFYNHQKIMLHVGLSKADICTGRILEFRRKTICIEQPIKSWNELRLVS